MDDLMPVAQILDHHSPQSARPKQISIFQEFVCNPSEEERLSNTFDLWDIVPRYAISRVAMNKRRNADGHLPNLDIDFSYRGTQLHAEIVPARLKVPVRTRNKTTGQWKVTLVEQSYYPSANEELVEDALRKLACENDQGFFDPLMYRSGVVFTLHQLRTELARRGHARRYDEITQSLRILAGSRITLTGDAQLSDRKYFGISGYLTSLVGVTRKDLQADPKAKWTAQFHPLVTHAIAILQFRQFNYSLMMSHRTQLARWLHKLLVNKYTFASISKNFELRFSTVARDSKLLDSYGRKRDSVAALQDALQELVDKRVLNRVTRDDKTNKLRQLEDVVFTLIASPQFIAEVKAANLRAQRSMNSPIGTNKPISLNEQIDSLVTIR